MGGSSWERAVPGAGLGAEGSTAESTRLERKWLARRVGAGGAAGRVRRRAGSQPSPPSLGGLTVRCPLAASWRDRSLHPRIPQVARGPSLPTSPPPIRRPARAGSACPGHPRSGPGPRFPRWQGPRTAYSRAFTRASLASMRIWISALEASSAAPDSSDCAFSRFTLAACRKWVAGESQAATPPGAPGSDVASWVHELPLEHSPPRPACPRSRPLQPTAALRNQRSL